MRNVQEPSGRDEGAQLDMTADREDRNNVYGRSGLETITADLSARLEAWGRDVKDEIAPALVKQWK